MEDLQSLLEKINRDGVEKAEEAGRRIIDDAKSRAAAILAEAKAQADAAKADAAHEAEASAQRAAETIRQAARDVVIELQAAFERTLSTMLATNVERALADEATLTRLVGEALVGLAGSGEIAAPERLAAALKAALAAQSRFTLRLDETVGAGFTVRQDGGRIEHDFTPAALAKELARRLRPELAKLVTA